jgi:hypothetical protein
MWVFGGGVLVFFIIGLILLIIGGNKSTSTNGEESKTETVGVILMAPGVICLLLFLKSSV